MRIKLQHPAIWGGGEAEAAGGEVVPGWLSITYRQIGGAGGGGPGPRQAGMPRPAVQQGAPHQLHIGILGREERRITGRIIRGDYDYCHVGNYEGMCWSDINQDCFRKYGNALKFHIVAKKDGMKNKIWGCVRI